MNSLALPIKAQGAPEKELELWFERVIELDDLPRAHQRTTPYKELDKIRAVHHQIALLLAAGYKQREVAERLGRDEYRISVLMMTPSFQQLVEEKRKEIEADAKIVILDNFQRWDRNQTRALDMIHERMEDEPEKFTIGQLLQIAGEGGDRVGPSKRQTNVNVNVDFAERLAAARKKMFGQVEELKALPAEGGPSLERDREGHQLAGKCQ